MDLKALLEIPPWEWPQDTRNRLLETVKDPQADPSDRLTAAELAGDCTVIHDELAGALLAVLANANESEEMRAQAAISFGAALETGWMMEFDDPGSVPISQDMFCHIQETLRQYYRDPGIPELVRRKILEASVRAPEDWHEEAIRKAYATGDNQWMLSAVFGMRYAGPGFEDQILEALKSRDPEIHYEAIHAAGAKELDAAWPDIVKLINDRHTPKSLLLAAIEAAGSIRPAEAGEVLDKLSRSRDEDIADAAQEAISIAGSNPRLFDEKDEDEDDEDDEGKTGGWIN